MAFCQVPAICENEIIIKESLFVIMEQDLLDAMLEEGNFLLTLRVAHEEGEFIDTRLSFLDSIAAALKPFLLPVGVIMKNYCA